MRKRIVLLGASGSIGKQVIDIVRQHSDLYQIVAVSVGTSFAFLKEYLEDNPVSLACIAKQSDAEELQKLFPETKIVSGDEGLIELTSLQECDLVVNALQGFVGLLPTLNAIEKGHDVALANKETLVACGQIVMGSARKKGVRVIPIDSEHSAIFQCLQGNDPDDISRLIITASGGSFRDLNRDQLKDVTLKQALAHPNWSMGHKITIDSATMMNKGFEVIEAHWLFDVDYDHIETILHRESVVHSMVEYKDHSLMAQLGVSDMRIPIQYALAYPERLPNSSESLDLAALSQLHFQKMDYERYPLLKLAFDMGKKGGNATAVMNGANERAVRLFLQEKISFLDIERLIFAAMEAYSHICDPTVEDIIASDRWAQEFVEGKCS